MLAFLEIHCHYFNVFIYFIKKLVAFINFLSNFTSLTK